MHAHQFWWASFFHFQRYCYFQKRPNFLDYKSMVIKKFNCLELAQKIHACRGLCQVSEHQFWWTWSLRFWRYCYFQKWPNFPFRPWYSPWSSKNLINWNRLKKFMHVGVYAKCMHTNFGGRGLFGFGDITTFKNGQISLSDQGHQKI